MYLLNDIIQDLSKVLKLNGYKKGRMTWYKKAGKLSIVFAIQKSQFCVNTWYYSFGIGLSDLAKKEVTSMTDCQIQYRIDNVVNGIMLTVDNISQLVIKWEKMYGTLQQLRICAIESRLPLQTTSAAIRYLTSVDLSVL